VKGLRLHRDLVINASRATIGCNKYKYLSLLLLFVLDIPNLLVPRLQTVNARRSLPCVWNCEFPVGMIYPRQVNLLRNFGTFLLSIYIVPQLLSKTVGIWKELR